LEVVQKTLAKFKEEHKDVSLWMEPGRFIIAESGVLLAKVTQIKEKGTEKRYIVLNLMIDNSNVNPKVSL